MPKCLDEVKARPPILSIASMILKERPAACSVFAAASPDDPAPTITTSTSSMAGFPSEKACAMGKDYSSSARRASGARLPCWFTRRKGDCDGSRTEKAAETVTWFELDLDVLREGGKCKPIAPLRAIGRSAQVQAEDDVLGTEIFELQ